SLPRETRLYFNAKNAKKTNLNREGTKEKEERERDTDGTDENRFRAKRVRYARFPSLVYFSSKDLFL
ncbi:MAG: hypothetical protein ACI4P3_05980, partial [Candidatus Spyradosoma sp.]